MKFLPYLILLPVVLVAAIGWYYPGPHNRTYLIIGTIIILAILIAILYLFRKADKLDNEYAENDGEVEDGKIA